MPTSCGSPVRVPWTIGLDQLRNPGVTDYAAAPGGLTTHGPLSLLRLSGPFIKDPAASYSPARLPLKYHRRWRA